LEGSHYLVDEWLQPITTLVTADTKTKIVGTPFMLLLTIEQ
jgi:hypothetical protein